MPLKVEIVGLTDLIKDVKKAGGNAEPLVKAALFNSGNLVQRNVRERAPHRTGTLQRSILNEVRYPVATVTVNEKYGQFIEEGTKPYDITPKTKKALFWNGALNPYKRVHHPGIKARPFFQPGVDASHQGIMEFFDKVTERLIREMAGR